MGDIVKLSELRRSRTSRRSEIAVSEPGTVALFTGVRIERWAERDPEPSADPRTRPTRPRSRRRPN